MTAGSKRVAIVQSSYIPWKGYFDLIDRVDEFILLDDVQFTRRDWRNRNKIKTNQGTIWLTIPVQTKGRYHQTIAETAISDPQWTANHWKSISQWYGGARHFESFRSQFSDLYLNCTETRLSLVNRRFLTAICEVLEISTALTWSWDYEVVDGATERLVHLCRQAGATQYLSGPSAKEYLDIDSFDRAGIEVAWMDYTGYPEYEQLHGPFEHGVSVVDVLFNEGPRARRLMKGRG